MTATTSPPVATPVGPHLPRPVTELLDTTAATRILAEAGLVITRAEPHYLRHKPGETTIVGYRFDTPDLATPDLATPTPDSAALGYAHWCASTTRAGEVYAKALTLHPRPSAIGVSIVRVDDHTVFYGFPNDARLRRLRWLTTPRKLKRVFATLAPADCEISKDRSTSTVLKYKPERRLVTRVDLVTSDGPVRSLLVRYTAGRHAPRLAAVADALRSNGVSTPTPRAQLDDGRVGVDDFIDGVELRTWLIDRDSVADELAESLHSFHATPAPTGTPVRTEIHDGTNAVNGLSALSLWDRDLARMAHGLADELVRRRPASAGPSGLIHGDLHDKNILIDHGRPWFIDLERTAVGSPASDLGRLRAHAISLDLRLPGWSPGAVAHAEDVVAAYRSRSGRMSASIDDAALGWHCAVALVDQALLVVRHVEPGWQDNAAALLHAATASLR